MVLPADTAVRIAVFDWLRRQRDQHGDSLSRESLGQFQVGDQRVPLVGPSGIWKPAVCELPISITTSYDSPYSDSYVEHEGSISYSYRGTDPLHRDNVGLRRAMVEQVPLVYFLALEPGRYAAAFPTFVVRDSPVELRFTLQVDDVAMPLQLDDDLPVAEPEPRRAYVTASVQRRLHQVVFRERVIRAYKEQCALCRLRHRELLDAAHITPDRDELGAPVVSNGLSLCKLHHAAFDRFFFAVRPDYRVEVRPSILTESDGPMLIVGLQQIHGAEIHLPSRRSDHPDRDRLEARYRDFQNVPAA